MHPSPPHSGRTAAVVRVTVAAAFAGSLAVAGPLPATAGSAAAPSAPATATGDTAPPRIRDVRFSRSSVRVAGLAVVPVTVSVRLTDKTGVREIPYAMTPSPEVTLSPVPGFQAKLRPVLTRTSGTVRDGVWSATVHVPSTWHGTVRVASIGAVDEVGNVLAEDLTEAESPALRVIGTHRPALTFQYSLLTGGGFRIHGRAYYRDTGRPLRRQPLATSYDSGCDLDGGARNDIVTDARGYYEKRWENGEDRAAGCVALIGRAAARQRPTLLAYHVASAPLPAIPDAAMLQPADLRGSTPEPFSGDDTWSALLPPQPCAGTAYPSAGMRRADRAIHAVVGLGDRPTVVLEHVATYRSDGARRYLRELRRGLAACTGPDHQGARWKVLATGVAGSESVLLRRRVYLDFVETYQNSYLVVARTGRALVVVASIGWEFGSGDEPLTRELATRAVRRAAVLNRH